MSARSSMSRAACRYVLPLRAALLRILALRALEPFFVTCFSRGPRSAPVSRNGAASVCTGPWQQMLGEPWTD